MIVYSVVVVMLKQHCSAVADKYLSFIPCTALFMHCYLPEIVNFVNVTFSVLQMHFCLHL